MLSVDQALKIILKHSNCLEEEKLPLLDSLGQAAAETLKAEINVPAFDSAAMDGYAVRSVDIKGATSDAPGILKVIDTVMAGSVIHSSITPGTAIRIMTGAELPAGADCVVRFEDTDEEKRRGSSPRKSQTAIGIQSEISTGKNIRKAGEEVKKGELIIQKGRLVGPGEVGVAASVGLTRFRVIRRPVVAIISTGDELVNPGKPLVNPQIYNSNCFSIAAQVKRSGGIPKILGIARDNSASLITKFHRSIEADAVITCGGSSAGDHDLVKEVVSKIGKVVFWKVNMAPGKPFSLCLLKDIRGQKENRTIPLFSLSGNPSACMINFEILVRPAILKMQGRTEIQPEIFEATLEDSVENKKLARCFLWANIRKQGDSYSARISRNLEQGVLPFIAAANGLVIVPEDKNRVEKGQKVQVMQLDWWEYPLNSKNVRCNPEHLSP